MSDIMLLKGDCFKLMDEMIKRGEKVDMICTDPPYGMGLTPQRTNGKFHDTKIINDDNLDWTDDFFDKCYKLTKNNSGHMFFCSMHSIPAFIQSAKKAGFTIKNLITWDKMWFGMGGNWRPNTEFILLCTRGRFVTKSNNKDNILRYRRLSPQKAQHPTQKPVELMKELISEPDYEPKLILDPFMGSGSTGVACKELGKDFIGIELETKYYLIASERMLGRVPHEKEEQE